MKIVHHAVSCPAGTETILIPVDRLTLAKTRWRGVAADGVEFGFDLAHPLAHGDCVHLAEGRAYVIEQAAEPVLEFHPGASPDEAAKLGWQLGNLHQVIEVEPGLIRVADDPAIRQFAAQQHLHPHVRRAIFRPFRAGAGHHHH